ncbi:MAG: hypothetical protein AAF657_23515 [Acidobacteriota bacterium]
MQQVEARAAIQPWAGQDRQPMVARLEGQREGDPLPEHRTGRPVDGQE